MEKLDLEGLLLNIFKEDKIRNKENTIFSQLTMITIKSLVPSSEFVGNIIDYKRFKEELSLLNSYKIDQEEIFTSNIEESLYFKYKDETIYSRILPIIISNKDYDVVEEECIKNIIYTTGNIEILLEWLAISRIIFMMIEEKKDIVEDLKQYIINMSQTDFLKKYGDKYLYDYTKSTVNFEVQFERVRVSMISLFHGIDMGKFKLLKDIFRVLNGNYSTTTIGKIIEGSEARKNINCEIDKSYENMAVYILKLRKSRIDPDDLKIKEYILPDVFSFKEGEVFFHSLLNNSKVIKKEIKDKSLISSIQTRAGMYLFKRDLLN